MISAAGLDILIKRNQEEAENKYFKISWGIT